MKVVVTGASGFFGWHLRCALHARGAAHVSCVDRAEWATAERLDAAVSGADVIFHLAGANRAEPDALRADNAGLARELTEALERTNSRSTIVYANSTQSGNGTPFGDGKRAAAEHLAQWGERVGATVVDVRVPNLFGEHGRPHYNSVVATFGHELATGRSPTIHQDRELQLLHVQDAVDRFLDLAVTPVRGVVDLDAHPMTVSTIRDLLQGFHELYLTGDIPDIADPLHLALFNTYRSFTFPQHYPIYPPVRGDNRGELFESVRAHGGQAQVFCSTTHPGYTRGEHYHLRKVERFQVLRGTAEIALRRLFTNDVVTFAVSGDRPAIVDMPTMWAHSITNTGDTELITLFWAHEVFDANRPDQYPELVHQ